ncbi:MAG: TolC family protein [Burkholderiales bacterium]|nr:TolC family protein [Burkholderiales bacterium]
MDSDIPLSRTPAGARFKEPAVAVICRFLEDGILNKACVSLPLVLLSLAAAAAPEADGRDPFGTSRYAPLAPGVRWDSPVPLPQVTEMPVASLPATDRPLALPELTELALQNNPRTRQAWFAARAAASAIGIERSDDLPRVSALVTVQRSESGGQAGNQINWLTRYGPAVTLTYLLFDFGAGESRVKAAEYQALAASLSQNRVLQDVVLLVEQSYYRLLGVEQLIRSNELFLKSVSTSLEATRRRREGGLATVADVYRAETQVAQGQLNLTRSQGELEKARGALAAAVGVGVNAALKVQTLESAPRIKEITESLGRILQRAKAARPDLVAAEAQALSARAQADAVARSGLPSVTINATTGRTFFHQDRPFTDTNSLVLGVSIPLFTGYEQTYLVRQAEARAAQAEAARDVLFRQTELEVWQAYYDVKTAAGGVSTTEVQLRAAQQTAEATLARYQAGFGSLLDLITAQVEESNARVQRIQSFLDWFTAVSRLNHAIGASDRTVYRVEQR